MRTLVVFFTAMFLLIFTLGIVLKHYRDNALLYREQLAKSNRNLALINKSLTSERDKLRKMFLFDKYNEEELNDAESKNETLRSQLISGSHRMFIRGKCATSGTHPYHTSTGMGDDPPIEISERSGQDILTLRAEIIRDNAKLKYLQEYVRKECH
ncbi:lysis system i-spanin subunit Rz [Rahnella sp. AN3-3W3]|uniref:lysis system i-spanin subunit Rz n=1 Tax=Rahnella sp. AN3-3W3 TaxID=1610578 RepID=UPI000DD3D447|nr:lysis system i-spanin subunit Rz [Rahnella sp. AN3-3W3]